VCVLVLLGWWQGHRPPASSGQGWSAGIHLDNVSMVQGPWGSKVETNFHDGNGEIVEIEVAYNKQYIVRIQTTYVLNGRTFKQAPQGGPGGDVAKVSDLSGIPLLVV